MDNLEKSKFKYFSNNIVKLIAIEEDDIELIQRWINDESISYFNGIRPPVSLSDQKIWYEKLKNDVSKLKLIVCDNAGIKVGMVSLINIDLKNRNCEIAVYINPLHQRKGYASSSLYLLLHYAFHELNLHKIYAQIFSFNSSSIKTFEHLGFQLESVLKEEYFSGNQFNDVLRYCIYEREFS